MTLCHDGNILPDKLQHFIDFLRFHLTLSQRFQRAVNDGSKTSFLSYNSIFTFFVTKNLYRYVRTRKLCE